MFLPVYVLLNIPQSAIDLHCSSYIIGHQTNAHS